MMHPHIPILPTARITSPQRVHRDCVQGAKMPFHSADLIFKDFVIETRFELALTRGRSGDVHGSLTAAKDDKGFFGRKGSGVECCVGGVGLEELEIPRRDQFGGFVFGGGNEVGAVGGGLDVGDLHAILVSGEGVKEFAGLSESVNQRYMYMCVTSDEGAQQEGSSCNGSPSV